MRARVSELDDILVSSMRLRKGSKKYERHCRTSVANILCKYLHEEAEKRLVRVVEKKNKKKKRKGNQNVRAQK